MPPPACLSLQKGIRARRPAPEESAGLAAIPGLLRGPRKAPERPPMDSREGVRPPQASLGPQRDNRARRPAAEEIQGTNRWPRAGPSPFLDRKNDYATGQAPTDPSHNPTASIKTLRKSIRIAKK